MARDRSSTFWKVPLIYAVGWSTPSEHLGTTCGHRPQHACCSTPHCERASFVTPTTSVAYRQLSYPLDRVGAFADFHKRHATERCVGGVDGRLLDIKTVWERAPTISRMRDQR